MQHRMTQPGPLLDERGRLLQTGYATGALLTYRRADIRAPWYRIKEWDYYLVLCDTHALALTIADNGYMGLDSVSLLDFTRPWQKTISPMQLLPRGRKRLPETSAQGDVAVSGRGYALSFRHEKDGRLLRVRMENFDKGRMLEGEILLREEPRDSMVIATPFPGAPRAFYYNQKINCLRAQGEVRLGDTRYAFAPESAFGTLDWGRGVWTYRNTWYWGSASGLVDGVPFGLNIGYGFGDTSAASENMVFYDGVAHKLSQVDFGIPQAGGRDDFLKPWRMTSDDGRFSMDFTPVLDRASRASALVVESVQHQVFGRFTGTVVLDDGRIVRVQDLMGFAEKVKNRW